MEEFRGQHLLEFCQIQSYPKRKNDQKDEKEDRHDLPEEVVEVRAKDHVVDRILRRQAIVQISLYKLPQKGPVHQN